MGFSIGPKIWGLTACAEWREDELFTELPAALRAEVAGVLLLGTLRRIPTFAECEPLPTLKYPQNPLKGVINAPAPLLADTVSCIGRSHDRLRSNVLAEAPARQCGLSSFTHLSTEPAVVLDTGCCISAP